MFDTPILFLIFNRPDLAQIVFNQIKKIQPKYLYVAADGPRANKVGENILCEKTRAIIKQVDWNCEVKTLFREQNLGCGIAVSNAITWFFNNVEQGIILEDDCLPQLTFFNFCESLLNYYKTDNNVMAISGFNAQLGISRTKHSYFFANIPLVWGWATWSHAWKKFEFDIDIIDENVFNNDTKMAWKKEIIDTYNGKMDSWAFKWIYNFLKNNFICVYPNVSLVRNIGIGENSTHTDGERWWYKHIKYGEIFAIQHPPKITINYKADRLTTNVHHNILLTLEDRIKRLFIRNNK